MNTDSQLVCQVAILGDSQRLPDRSAKVLFQHQRDFNYLELRYLLEDAEVGADGVKLAGMHYRAIILDRLPHLAPQFLPKLNELAEAGRLIIWGEPPAGERLAQAIRPDAEQALIAVIDRLTDPPALQLASAQRDIRLRHVVKQDRHFFMLFNEGDELVETGLQLRLTGQPQWWDPQTGQVSPVVEPVQFAPHEMKLLALPVTGQ